MPARFGVIFDMDGVLTDTAALHCQSWQALAATLDMPFSLEAYEVMRGLAREDSLRLFLGDRFDSLSADERQRLMDRKQADFLERLEHLTVRDRLPGVSSLIHELRQAGVPRAVASSSRNTRAVLERIGLADAFDVVVDANDDLPSKPSPALFLEAARRLGLPPAQCVVIEDAAAGVEAALAAGMGVVGLGPSERLRGAQWVVGSLTELRMDDLAQLLVV